MRDKPRRQGEGREMGVQKGWKKHRLIYWSGHGDGIGRKTNIFFTAQPDPDPKEREREKKKQIEEKEK